MAKLRPRKVTHRHTRAASAAATERSASSSDGEVVPATSVSPGMTSSFSGMTLRSKGTHEARSTRRRSEAQNPSSSRTQPKRGREGGDGADQRANKRIRDRGPLKKGNDRRNMRLDEEDEVDPAALDVLNRKSRGKVAIEITGNKQLPTIAESPEPGVIPSVESDSDAEDAGPDDRRDIEGRRESAQYSGPFSPSRASAELQTSPLGKPQPARTNRPGRLRRIGKASTARRSTGLPSERGSQNDDAEAMIDKAEEQEREEERLAECYLRDQKSREAKELEGMAETEELRRKWDAFAKSTHQIAQQPSLISLKWHTVHESVPPSSYGATSEVRGSSGYKPWSLDEKAWLLDQLSRRDRKDPRPTLADLRHYAEILQRPLEEVKQEARLLRKAARDLADEKGIDCEPWAAFF